MAERWRICTECQNQDTWDQSAVEKRETLKQSKVAGSRTVASELLWPVCRGSSPPILSHILPSRVNFDKRLRFGLLPMPHVRDLKILLINKPRVPGDGRFSGVLLRLWDFLSSLSQVQRKGWSSAGLIDALAKEMLCSGPADLWAKRLSYFLLGLSVIFLWFDLAYMVGDPFRKL